MTKEQELKARRTKSCDTCQHRYGHQLPKCGKAGKPIAVMVQNGKCPVDRF